MSTRAEEAEVVELIEAWARAVRAGDMEGILANHAENIVMFDVPAPLQSTGMAEYTKTWELFFEHCPPGEEAFNIEQLKLLVGDNVAFAYGLLRINGSDKPVCRLTIGLRKEAGRWLINHEHHSAPHSLGAAR
jgi:ketosteroid isomerase-like protein